MTRALAGDREKTAERLLNSSAKKFYDPEVDIDWSADVEDDRFYTPEHRISLYGTELYERLTREQRVELSKHEAASVASNGIWFEVLLMQMLLKEVYDADPTERHAQYAMTEVAEECRHSTMFARAIEKFGVPAYGPRRSLHHLAKLLPTVGWGPALYGSILVAEEVLDRLQRESMSDETVQPLIRMVNRIHVLEEARHVTFAREEVTRGIPELNRVQLAYQRFLIGFVAFSVVRSLVNPRVYKAVGIRPRDGFQAAQQNPHYQETIRWAGERIMTFLDEAGLLGGPGMWFWRRAGLVSR